MIQVSSSLPVYRTGKVDKDLYSCSEIETDNKISRNLNVTLEEQFMRAVKSKNIREVEEFVSRKVTNFKSEEGVALLTLASSLGRYDLIAMLVKRVNLSSFHKNTSSILALCRSKSKNEDELLKCMDLLLAQGANINSCDNNGVSALSHAVQSNHDKLILKLINKGADINKTDCDGWSPIFYAVGTNNIHLVYLLKDYSAKLFDKDKRGRTIMDVACEMENEDIVELLNSYCCRGKWFDKDERKENTCLNVYPRLVSELPRKGDRLSGYSREINKILTSVQLGHLENEFQLNNFDLGHLLTVDEAKLKKIGIHFWFERRKLLHAVEKFHECPWSSRSLRVVNPHQDLDYQIALLIGTITRQIHIISLSTFWWFKLGGVKPEEKPVYTALKDSLLNVYSIRSNLKVIRDVFKEINVKCCTEPSDLISPPAKVKKYYFKHIVFATMLSTFFVYKNDLCLRIFYFFKNQFPFHFLQSSLSH